MVDDPQVDLPLAYHLILEDHPLPHELPPVKVNPQLLVLMSEGVGRDQRLKPTGSYVVNEGYLLHLQVDHQHAIHDVEDRDAVGRQFDDDRPLLIVLYDRHQLQLTLAR